VLTAQRLPRWAVVVGGVWALWVALCLMLMVLPYGGGPELGYDLSQQLVANLGPALGMTLVGGLAVQLVSIPRAHPARAAVEH
jgi:alpha-1,2-mannosyltransferase